MSNNWNHCVLSLAPFTQHNASEILPSVARISSSFYFIAEQHSIMYGCTTTAYHSPNKGLLDGSNLGGIMNNVINICVQDFV